MKKICIVILNFNGIEDTLACIISFKNLKKSKHFSFSLLVVDNNSVTDPLGILNKKFPEIKVIRNKENLGYSGGNNVGINFSLQEKYDYILILNNDTVVDPNFLQELFLTGEQIDNVGIVVPKIYFFKGNEYHKERYKKDELGKVIWYAGGCMDWKNVIGFHRGVDEVDKDQYAKLEETEIATGSCMLIKKEVFDAIGLLDERYFLYYEDSDFSMRAKKAGFKIYFTPMAYIWHKNAGSAGGSGSELQDYYISRNRLLFGFSYASFRAKMALVKEAIQLLIKGREWQRKGVVDFFLRKFYKGSF